MAGTITALGIGSNILTSDLIEKMREAETKARITPFTKKTQKNLDQQTSLTKITSLLNSINSSAKKFADTSTYLERASSVSGNGVSATIGAGLPVQDISVKVDQLAQSDINQVGTKFATRESVFSATNSTLKFHANGKNYSIPVKAGATLSDVAQSITDATEGAVMGIVMKTGGTKPFQLMINSKETGADSKIYFGTTLTGNVNKAGSIEAGAGDLQVTIKDRNGADKTLDITFGATESGSDAIKNAEAIQKAIAEAIKQASMSDPDLAGVGDQINVGLSSDGRRVILNDSRGQALKVSGNKAEAFGFKNGESVQPNTIEGMAVKGGQLTGKFSIGGIDLDLSTLTSAGNDGTQNAEAVRDAINNAPSSDLVASVKNGTLIINKKPGVAGNIQITLQGADGSEEQKESQKAVASMGLVAGAHQSYASFQEEKLKLTNIQSAQDAKFTYNNIKITRASNSISDVVSGVNLELNAVHKDQEVSVIRVTRDNKTIFEEAKSFVDSFNELLAQLEEDTRYDADTKVAGVFQGDSDITGIRSALVNLISHSDSGYSLYKYGIAMGENGRLSIDSKKFSEEFEKDPEKAMGFFKGEMKKVAGRETEVKGVFRLINDKLEGYVKGENARLKLLETKLTEDSKFLTKQREKAQADMDSRYALMADRFAAYDTLIAKINQQSGALNMMIEQSMK